MNYAHIINNTIMSIGTVKILNPEYSNIEICDSIYNNILKFGINYYLYENEQFIENPNYVTEQAQKERECLAMLSLTAADVERAIYKAKGLDFEDILEQLSGYAADQLGGLDLKALKIELKANNFYRGNPYVIQIGTLLGFSSEQLDYLFEHGCFEEQEVNNNA